MTFRPISQTGGVKLLMAGLALLMIAAVACSSGKDSDEPTAVATQSTTGGSESPVLTEADASATAEANVELAIGALFLEMISPDTDELFVTQNSYEFSGRTTVDALLSVNDYVVDVDEQGRFAFEMDLEEGPNIVEVIASNALGEQFDEVLLVIYEPV